MKVKIKYLLSIALILSILLPVFPVRAQAAGVTILPAPNNQTLIYDAAKGELTLNNYIGDPIEIKGPNVTLITVKLIGNNVIDSTDDFGIINRTGGALDITSDQPASLTIKMNVANRYQDKTVYGIAAWTGNNYIGGMELKGKAKVKVEITRNHGEVDSIGQSIGLGSISADIKEEAGFEFKVDTKATRNDAAIGIDTVYGVAIDTKGEVLIDASESAGFSYALHSQQYGQYELNQAERVFLKGKRKNGQGGASDKQVRFSQNAKQILFAKVNTEEEKVFEKIFSGKPRFTQKPGSNEEGEIHLPINATAAACLIVTEAGVSKKDIDISGQDYKDHRKVAIRKAELPSGVYQVEVKVQGESVWAKSEKFDLVWSDDFLAKAKIKGEAVYGETLEIELESLDGSPIEENKLTYQWYRDYKGSNQMLLPMTGKSYTIQKEDVNKIIGVEIKHTEKNGMATAQSLPIQKAKLKITYDKDQNLLEGQPIVITHNSIELPVGGEAYLFEDNTGFHSVVGKYKKDGLHPGTAVTIKMKKQPVTPEEQAVYLTSDVLELKLKTLLITDLSGQVIVNGMAEYGQTLTAEVKNTNNSGQLRYQWKRDDVNIAGANANTYQLAKEDIGHSISCEVKSSVQTGSISGVIAGKIEKAKSVKPAKPELESKTGNMITVKAVSGQEYRLNNGNWGSNVFSGLQAATSYRIYTRVKETETHKVSEVSEALEVTTDSVSSSGNPITPYNPGTPSAPSIPSVPSTPSKPDTSKKDGKTDQNKMESADKLPFADVKKDDWYAEAIKFVHQAGLMKGTAEATFNPHQTTTRGQLITVLYRLAGNPEVKTTVSFMDVKADAYYNHAVAWAIENGISTGYDKDMFGADDNITREQLAVLLYRMVEKKGQKITTMTDLSTFADQAEVSEFAVKAMTWATENGLLKGIGNQMLAPKGHATRAEIAAIIMRFQQNKK